MMRECRDILPAGGPALRSDRPHFRKTVLRFGWLAFLLAAGACGEGFKPAAPAAHVLVAAASSLREVLLETAPAWEAAHPGLELGFSFDASSTLARQITEGARFDVFLSADSETMDRVRAQVDQATVTPFLRNKLALMAREGLERPASSPAALAAATGNVAMAGPEVPAGKYARTWLAKAGLLADLTPRIVTASSARAALRLVEAGEADYAFVFATEAGVAKTTRLVWTATDEAGTSVVYVAAAMAGAPAAAGGYVTWLSGGAFAEAAEKMGFQRLKR
jgi:molybdate transport system substrate-binding protein